MLQFRLLKFVYPGRKQEAGEKKGTSCQVFTFPARLCLLLPCGWVTALELSLDSGFFYNSLFLVARNFLTNKEHPSDDFHYSASKQSTLEPTVNTAGDCFPVLSPPPT